MFYDETFGVCEKCGADKVKNPKTGKIFCSKKCWLSNVPAGSQNAPTGQNTSHNAYPVQPKAEIKRTMDYKAEQIGKAQDNKEESIRLSSSGRDATMIITSMYAGNAFTDEQIKEKIKEWRNWFYCSIYSMSEDEYQRLNSPW